MLISPVFFTPWKNEQNVLNFWWNPVIRPALFLSEWYVKLLNINSSKYENNMYRDGKIPIKLPRSNI